MIEVTEFAMKRCFDPVVRGQIAMLMEKGLEDAAVMYSVMVMTADENSQVRATDKELEQFINSNRPLIDIFIEICGKVQ